MKNKPHKHRESNTHKFQGNYKKLKGIKVNLTKFVLKKTYTENANDTLLWQTICNLKDENISSVFQEFQDALGVEIQILPQLLLKEKKISSTIKHYLELADTFSLPAILQALIAFSRDTEKEFYKNHFYDFIPILMQLISTNISCSDTLHNVFDCFLSLFCIFRRHLKDDFHKLFVKYKFCTLLSKKQQFSKVINGLAAQSLCPLLRIENNQDIVNICLKRVSKCDDEADGLGLLFYHSMKHDELSWKLHSTASTTFSVFLDCLKETKYNVMVTFKVLSVTLKEVMNVLHAAISIEKNNRICSYEDSTKSNLSQDCKNLWNIIFDKVDSLENTKDYNESYIKYLIEVILQITKFESCVLVNDFEKCVGILSSISKMNVTDETGIAIGKIAVNLMSSDHYKDVPDEVGNNFLKAFFTESSFSPSVVFDFVDLSATYDFFDITVLPFYLRFIVSTLTNQDDPRIREKVLDSLFKVVNTNAMPVRTMRDMELWSKYLLDFTNFNVKNSAVTLLSNLLYNGLASDLSNLEEILKACVCLPHVSPLIIEDVVPYMFCVMDDALDRIQKEAKPVYREDDKLHPRKKKNRMDTSLNSSDLRMNVNTETNEESLKLIFLCSVLVESLYHLINDTENFLKSLSDMRFLKILKENVQYRENVHLLKILDIHLTSLLEERRDGTVISESTLKEIYPILAPSLASHKPLVRLLVSHIFSLFPYESIPTNLPGTQLQNIFTVMFEVEACEISPLEYKEKLRLLSKLDVNNATLSRPLDDIYKQAPLLFLIGQLYVNLTPMWQPIIKSIAQYAYALSEESFWKLWVEKLKIASHHALRTLCNKIVRNDADTSFDDISLKDYHFSLVTHPGYLKLNLKPDYRKFRDLLWKAMQQFPDICERKNKDVVILFMNFLHKELFPVDFDVAPTQDISVQANEDKEITEEDDEENFQKEEEEEEDHSEIDARQRVRKAPTESLCEHLTLFAKFHNPKVIYKSKELENIYCEFLSHPYAKAQKLALDSIMTYNHKFLTPYRETLYNILDDKKFKSEITLFDIEGNNEDEVKSLKTVHRKNFMPFLVRVLYGKMQYKTGSHTSGKSKTGVRKTIILRFLAGANEDELDTFLNLSFDIMLSHLNGTALDVVEIVQKNIDPKKVVPLKRLKGALGTLDRILDEIGHLLENKRSFILKVTLFILSTSIALIENSEVSPIYLKRLKDLRQLSIQKIIMFFTNFENFKWSEVEIEAVFQSVVWPSLPKLPDEGIYSPTPLLRLFLCWGENPSFHILLSRHQKYILDVTPMPYIMKLINHPKCSLGVVNIVFDLVDNLLNSGKKLMDKEDQKEEEEEEEIEQEFKPFDSPMKNVLPLIKEAKDKSFIDLTIGESLVWSCMDDLLLKLKNSLTNLKKDSEIKKRELKMLIRVGQWIREEKDAIELLSLIVSLLKKNCVKQEEKVVLLLEMCCKLFGIVSNSEEYIKDIISMFLVFGERKCRSTLCNVIRSMCKENNKSLQKWCCDLNSFTGEMVEEIDAETRLKCFREVNRYLNETDELDELIVSFLINQNFWVLNQAGNQGFRDLSVLCLKTLVEMLSRIQDHSLETVKRILKHQILSQIKSGLKHKNDATRTAMMSILCTLVHKCYKLNRSLSDLFQVADVNDLEVDFFTNMHHLQLSRRAKALSRLTSLLSEGKIHFQVETITEIILPVASSYLFKDEFASEGNLLMSCVTCIGALARQLPWFSYQHLLKYYLNLMSRELKQLKLAVRVLEAILDAFHEDLTGINTIAISGEEIIETVIAEPDGNNTETMATAGDDDSISKFRKRPLEKDENSERVCSSLRNFYIPKLQKILSERSLRDTEHKVNKKKYPEDEDIKKIPLALAIVKLLKKLPRNDLVTHANSVVLKLINFLKSKLDTIRREARDMLVKVMKELGGEFLQNLVQDLKSILIRGYQTHVLVYSLHAILSALEDSISANHIDPCVGDIMEICIEDIFGDKADEKSVTQITTKVREAKTEKGYAIMGILAQVISVDKINAIISPLKEKLQTHNKKVVNKVARCLQKIGVGLQRNKNISVEHKSLFVYSNLKERLEEFSLDISSNKSQNQKETVRKDSFLIEPEPRKVRLEPKTNVKTTFHVVVKFSLSFLADMIKHGQFLAENKEHCSLLDPYVQFMSQVLLSEYPEVSIQALHVISGLIRFPLPSIDAHIKKIFGQMFVILNKFASSGLTKGNLSKLVQLDIRVLSLIIKDVSSFKLEPDHSKLLIHYSKVNLEDCNQYHSSFIILNALIIKKISCQELHDLMFVIRNMSVLSTNLNMLDQARRAYLNYISIYPKKKNQLVEVFMFFVKNISYSVISGRMSAILSVQELISKDFTAHLDATEEIALLFKITEQLFKKNPKELKLLLKKVLKSLYDKSIRKNLLTDNCFDLLKGDLLKSNSDNFLAIHIGIETLIPMLQDQSSEQAKTIINQVISKAIDLLHPNRYQIETEKPTDNEVEQCQDLALASLLDFILMVVENKCKNSNLTQWAESVNVELWKHIKSHLLYPNVNVRLISAVIFGKLFGSYPIHEIAVPYVASTTKMARSLVVDFCNQLTTECPVESPMLNELRLASVRNLVYLVRQGKKVPISNPHKKNICKIKTDNINGSDDDEGNNDINSCPVGKSKQENKSSDTNSYLDGAYWVLRKVGILAYDELKTNPKNSTSIRDCFINLIGGLVVILDQELVHAPSIISFIVNHITRELSDKSLPEALATRTKELSELVREKIGIQRYNEETVRVQTVLEKKRTKRKARERERCISNPEMAMKKKSKKHADKKEAKKRKYAELKVIPNKKRRLKEMVMVGS